MTTKEGATIKDALDYAITLPAGTETASELWPNVVAVGAVYGDAAGAYAKWMLDHAGKFYPADAQFLWNQPFSDSGLVAANESASGSAAIADAAGGAARAGDARGAAAAAALALAAGVFLLGA